MDVKKTIKAIQDRWFLSEPVYFSLLCTQPIQYEDSLRTPICCGKGRVYICPKLFENNTERYIEQALKVELLRILLRHPYQRQLPDKVRMYIASNLTIANNTKFDAYKLKTKRDIFKKDKHDIDSYEDIYKLLPKPEQQAQGTSEATGKSSNSGKGNGKGKSSTSPQSGSSEKENDSSNEEGSGSGTGNDPYGNFDNGCRSSADAIERTKYWGEDDYQNEMIKQFIRKQYQNGNHWGTIPGEVVQQIEESLKPKFNYKVIFEKFRGTIISSKRRLTRMKPNRRFGYEAMGSKRQFTTKILVAADTSGSISDKDLQYALGFIKGFFKYGISEIDVISFDTQIYKDSLCTIRKPHFKMNFKGRGGTDFNDVFAYVQDPHKKGERYNGVIILTDGYAEVPKMSHIEKNYGRVKYLWCLNSEDNYKNFTRNDAWKKFGDITYLEIPNEE